MKLTIKLEPFGSGVKSREEADYYGFTVDGEYKEFDPIIGKAIIKLIKLIKDLTN